MDKQNKVDIIIKGFLSFLKKENCLELLPQILSRLTTLSTIDRIKVVSPIELDALKREKIQKLIKKLTGLKNFEVNYETDESIIDGIKIMYQDKMWDMSLSTQIKKIVNAMK